MHMYTSSKVTHAKYAVAETHIPSVKVDYCDTCIEKFMTTANYVFCIEFQDRKLMLNHVRRQNG